MRALYAFLAAVTVALCALSLLSVLFGTVAPAFGYNPDPGPKHKCRGKFDCAGGKTVCLDADKCSTSCCIEGPVYNPSCEFTGDTSDTCDKKTQNCKYTDHYYGGPCFSNGTCNGPIFSTTYTTRKDGCLQ